LVEQVFTLPYQPRHDPGVDEAEERRDDEEGADIPGEGIARRSECLRHKSIPTPQGRLHGMDPCRNLI